MSGQEQVYASHPPIKVAEQMITQRQLTLTQRELTEVKHALIYFHECNHGTVGHNMLVIIAKMAVERGFGLALGDSGYEVSVPDGVTIQGS